MAPLCCAANFDPFLSLDCAISHPPPWRNPKKIRDQILPSGNTGHIWFQDEGGGDATVDMDDFLQYFQLQHVKPSSSTSAAAGGTGTAAAGFKVSE